ncbi:hypothetical protein BC827DRAFT_1235458 [Russula dissimulans]|nr:hypothetical protein BC827DRAFT_1235458 [Russula dissimulans]
MDPRALVVHASTGLQAMAIPHDCFTTAPPSFPCLYTRHPSGRNAAPFPSPPLSHRSRCPQRLHRYRR